MKCARYFDLREAFSRNEGAREKTAVRLSVVSSIQGYNPAQVCSLEILPVRIQ